MFEKEKNTTSELIGLRNRTEEVRAPHVVLNNCIDCVIEVHGASNVVLNNCIRTTVVIFTTDQNSVKVTQKNGRANTINYKQPHTQAGVTMGRFVAMTGVPDSQPRSADRPQHTEIKIPVEFKQVTLTRAEAFAAGVKPGTYYMSTSFDTNHPTMEIVTTEKMSLVRLGNRYSVHHNGATLYLPR